MNTHALPKQRMTVPEFLTWSDKQPETERYELVDGEIVAMTRDTVRHNRAKTAAFIALRDAIGAAGVPCEVFIDGVGVRINDATLRIPDVVVHCGAEPDPRAMIVGSPLIVVEVVSPSSERDDTNSKIVDYLSVASIHHYLIIFSQKRVVVHHRRNERGNFETHIAHGGDIMLQPPGMAVAVNALLGPSFDEGTEPGQ